MSSDNSSTGKTDISCTDCGERFQLKCKKVNDPTISEGTLPEWYLGCGCEDFQFELDQVANERKFYSMIGEWNSLEDRV